MHTNMYDHRILTTCLILICLLAECNDVANVTLFLLSDYASYVNGVSIPVDGGFLTS